MNKKALVATYFLFDYINSALAWFIFFVFRKVQIEKQPNFKWQETFNDERFWYGITFIPLFWISLFAINGFYQKILRRSRLTEFIQSFWITLIGTVILFFILLLDDDFGDNYKAYYKAICALFVLQFSLIYLPKFLLTSSTAHKIHQRKFGFNSLIIGDRNKAKKLVNELNNAKRSAGYVFKGFISVKEAENRPLEEILPKLGGIDALGKSITDLKIEEVIIALEKKELNSINRLISELQEYDVRIKLIADMHNILTGQVKMNSIFHAALIEIDFEGIPYWQRFAKRAFDVLVSSLVLILFSPLYLALAIAVKTSSKGPVFFTQSRIGKKGKPFNIIKFRSMYINAEKSGPQLSKENDARITKIGKTLRKTRMDEIPQFFNVLKGEMSIVGPRPERLYFIEQICQKAPQYKFLYKIKPGITSWGQVKYGYAENVNEMIDRLKFDLIYLENRSLLVDLKIMIYTILVIFQGKGK